MKPGIISNYSGHLADLLTHLDFEQIEKIVGLLESARLGGKTVWMAGNGGSAATGNHFATDLSWRARSPKPPYLRAISLTTNMPMVTALGNDAGYENIFVEQLKTMFQPGDLLIAISASGNSPNVLRAVEYVNNNKGVTIGFTGFDGGELKNLCQKIIHIKTQKGEYELVEDIHMIVCHMLSVSLRRLHSNATS